MSKAFVLGNGISRRDISVSDLERRGKIYGCNALYRECTPHALVATDTPIARRIQENGYPLSNRFYTRRPIVDSGALRIPQEYYRYSSGPNALAIAALDKYKEIYLLGFDMGPTTEQKFNNVYAGTEFYQSESAPPTFVGNWVTQLYKVISDFPDTKFIRVYGATTVLFEELNELTNLSSMDICDFISLINNEKDS